MKRKPLKPILGRAPKISKLAHDVGSDAASSDGIKLAKIRHLEKGKAITKKPDKVKKLQLFSIKGKSDQGPYGKNEKLDWNKLKKERKELKKSRKEKKNTHYTMTVEAKQIWEKIRRADCPSEKRKKLLNDLHGLLKGKMESVIHSHDMARTVQWLLKLGTPEIRAAISTELCPLVVTLAQSKYASFCAKHMLEYGDEGMRKAIIEKMMGSVVKLLNHTIASSILERAYFWANRQQKDLLRQELYGELFKSSKDSSIKKLEDVFSKTPDMKPAILSTTKSILTKICEKKHLLGSTLFHVVLLDYLTHCEEKDRNEMLESLYGSTLEILHTKEGSKVGVMMIWHANTKGKKLLVKELKNHVKEIAVSENGHTVLLAIFDSVDDTVLIKKALLPGLLASAEEIACDEFGRKVFLYLVAHRDNAYFHPGDKSLADGDAVCNKKKANEVREKELLAGVSEPLVTKIKTNPSHWMKDSSIGMLTLAVLKSATGEALREALTSVASFFTNRNSIVVEKDKSCPVVEHTGLHMILKKLIKHDKSNHDLDTFAAALVNNLTEETLLQWIQLNRGCFALVLVMECECAETVEKLKDKFSKAAMKQLKQQTSTGAAILQKKLV